MKVFKPIRWGSIKVFQVPCAIFQSEPLFPISPSLKAKPSLTLRPSPLTILLVLYEIAKSLQGKPSDPVASVTLKQKLLMERTGLSKNVVTSAAQELEDEAICQTRRNANARSTASLLETSTSCVTRQRETRSRRGRGSNCYTPTMPRTSTFRFALCEKQPPTGPSQN